MNSDYEDTDIIFECKSEGSSVAQRSIEEAETFANASNLVAFFPLDNEVFLDIDRKTYTFPDKILDALRAGEDHTVCLTMTSHLITKSKSGNTHVYIRFDRTLSDLERLVVQTVLGSDPIKEALTLMRMLQGGTGSVALFETAEEATRVMRWRKNDDNDFLI